MSVLVLPEGARRRLVSRGALLSGVVAIAAVLLVSAYERYADPTSAVDRALSFCFGVVLPLLCYSAWRRAADGGHLARVQAGLSRYGENRRRAVLITSLVLGPVLAVAAVLLAAVALVTSHGVGDGHLGPDLLATLPVAALGATAYAGWLALGASFGARGTGIVWLLLVDWVVGSTSLPIAAAVPRGHVRHLLGLDEGLGFSQWISSPALLGLGLLCLALALWRVPR